MNEKFFVVDGSKTIELKEAELQAMLDEARREGVRCEREKSDETLTAVLRCGAELLKTLLDKLD